jgi:hypothetical protein
MQTGGFEPFVVVDLLIDLMAMSEGVNSKIN